MTGLDQLQEERESVAKADGADRFHKALATARGASEETRVGAARSLLLRALEPTEAAFTTLVERAKTDRRTHLAVRWIAACGPRVAAYLVCKAVFDIAYQRPAVTEAGMRVADFIADQVRVKRLSVEKPGLFIDVTRKFRTQSKIHRTRVYTTAMKQLGMLDPEDLRGDPRRKILVGVKLVDLMIEATGLFEVTRERSSTGTRRSMKVQARLELKAEALEWLEKRNELLSFLDPIHLPMVVPPKPWAPGERGGYRYALADSVSLVRTPNQEYARRVERCHTMPTVFSALNTLQDVRWKVNQDVLALYASLPAGRNLPGLYEHDVVYPPKPVDIDTNDAARKAWRKVVGVQKSDNHFRRLQRLALGRVIYDAQLLQGHEAFHFVYSLDFRGRIYPVTSYLSPQGADEVKALLTFADAKPLGEHGESYLALHGMNMLGQIPNGPKVSTMTLEERLAWVIQHSGRLAQVGEDPWSDRWWQDADKPMQFYAFCCEWARLEAHVKGGGDLTEFRSSLPVAQDGSCNGVQHFAAMLRDEKTGVAVNLVPTARPADLYLSVSEMVLQLLERSEHPWAPLWLSSGMVDRALCKRPTMTFGYGSQRFGFAEQIRDVIRNRPAWFEQHLDKHFVVEGKGLMSAASFLSSVMWEAIMVQAAAAFSVMEWMRASVKAVVGNNKPVQWRVPETGFPVQQEYYSRRSQRVDTMLQGRVFQPRIRSTDLKKLDPVKQQNAIAPNVVHSLDAACLMLTVKCAKEQGVASFGMVHDSYATVAGDMVTLARLTRTVFVDFYETHDVLALLYREWLGLSGEALELYPPMPPERGTLDLKGVIESAYFFA